jgi:hypothetical protein
MSGPPVPHPNPAPGSNAIGSFAIGISSIGTISTFDVWQTVLSQYANSPTLTDMILSFNAALDQTENFDQFYDLEWNVATAQGYGLDIWGRIVGVSRTLELPPSSVSYLGFEEAGSWSGFNQSPFFSGGTITSNFSLSDADFRTLIYAKALSNICDGSIPAINQLLLSLFPNRGACYVQDNGGMSLTYTFDFTLTPVELAIIGQSDVLPNPVGVAITIEQV